MSKQAEAVKIARELEQMAATEYADCPQDEVISELVATVEQTHDREMMELVAEEVGL